MRFAVKNDSHSQLNPIFARRLETHLRQTALRPPLWKNLSIGAFTGSPVWAATIAFVPPIPEQIKDVEILQALEKLPQTFCEVIFLADVEEFSYKETAELLQVPIGTVMSRLSRGRKLLAPGVDRLRSKFRHRRQ